MKFKTVLFAVLAAGIPMDSSAFTLDAVGCDGAGLSPTPVTVLIPGHGELIVETANDSGIVLISNNLNGDDIGRAPLDFDPSESIQIRRRDVEPQEVDFDSQPSPREWSSIPEATSALLGLIGATLILLRRRN